MRGLVKGKRWLLLSRWVHLDSRKRQLLNELFRLNRRMMKAYLLKESLDRLWTYHYEGAALRYLHQWIDQLRWQRLETFKKLAEMLLSHLEGILNYCRVPVRFGVVEAVNGNIKSLLRRGRGYPPNWALVAIEYDAQGWRAPVKSSNWSPLTGSR